MPIVVVPPPYRGPTAGEGEIRVDAATVRGCIEAVEARFPGFRDQVLDGHGRVHRFVNLFVNGDEIERERLELALRAEDRLEILAAIAGGSAVYPGAGRPLVCCRLQDRSGGPPWPDPPATA